jgi:hypothetical protein
MATRENRETDIRIVVGRLGMIRRRERCRYGEARKPRTLLFPNYVSEFQRSEHIRTKADWVTGLSEKLVKRLLSRLVLVQVLRAWLPLLLTHEASILDCIIAAPFLR